MIFFTKELINNSLISSCIAKKFGAIQVWPQFKNFPKIILFDAISIETFLSIIQGFFPPSSRVTGVSVFAASNATIFPISVLPVKKI